MPRRGPYRSSNELRGSIHGSRWRQATRLIADKTDPEHPPTEKQAKYLADLIAGASTSPLVDIGDEPLTAARARAMISKLAGRPGDATSNGLRNPKIRRPRRAPDH